MKPNLTKEWYDAFDTTYHYTTGALGIVHLNDHLVISGVSTHPTSLFSRAMLRDIIRLYKEHNLVIIADTPQYFPRIEKALVRYGFKVRSDALALVASHSVNKRGSDG